MKTAIFKKLASVATLSVLLVAFASSAAFAQDAADEFDADIEIVAPLQLENTANLDFGQVAQPQDGDATFGLTPDNDTTGDDELAVGDERNPGAFELFGDDDRSVEVTSEITDQFAQGVELLSIDVEALPDDNWDAEEFNFGGEVSIDEGADTGEYNATVELTAGYE